VVNYDEKTGKVLHKQTCQGYSDNSTWARGQAWGIYGFVMAYRETQRADFLKVAKNMADFFIEHPNLPEDGIPYWDFNVNQEGYTPDWDYSPSQFAKVPTDASAAAITASAFLELSRYVSNGTKYFDFAEKQLKSLASPKYRAQPDENNHFLLKHSVGSIPHEAEVDVPLIYADYYFLEALNRYQKLSR
jgi:chondroitin AC lyase